MKIEKITDNKIRIIVNLDELVKNEISLDDFMQNNPESQKFFLKILTKAEKEIGFNTQGCKLLIETFSSLDEIFIFTITKFNINHPSIISPKPISMNKKYKKSSIIKTPIYKFNNFDEFCNLCIALNNSNIPINNIAKKISLYLYKNTYYLTFSEFNLSYNNFKKLFSLLSEFAFVLKISRDFNAKLYEYGKIIISKNAFKTGFKYFV